MKFQVGAIAAGSGTTAFLNGVKSSLTRSAAELFLSGLVKNALGCAEADALVAGLIATAAELTAEPASDGLRTGTGAGAAKLCQCVEVSRQTLYERGRAGQRTGVKDDALRLGLNTNGAAVALILEVDAFGTSAGFASAAASAAAEGDGDDAFLGLKGGISAIPRAEPGVRRGGPAGLGRLTLTAGLGVDWVEVRGGAALRVRAGGLGETAGVLEVEAAGVFLPSRLEMSSGTGLGSCVVGSQVSPIHQTQADTDGKHQP